MEQPMKQEATTGRGATFRERGLMDSKSTDRATPDGAGVTVASFQGRAKNAQPKRYSERTVEPQRIVLDSVESAVLDQIVEARVARGLGSATHVRIRAIREIVASGLLAVSRGDRL